MQGGRQHQLSRSEKQALRRIASEGEAVPADDGDLSFAERAIKRARMADKTGKYVLVDAVVPASNCCERLFSQARALIGINCHSLEPITKEGYL